MFRIRSEMPRALQLALGILPFVLLLAGYFVLSHQRLKVNPRDKLTPGPAQFAKGWGDVWKRRVVGTADYVVQPGDTLESVADAISGDASFAGQITWEDPQVNTPRPLEAGEVLRVPRTERRFVTDTIVSLRLLAAGLIIGVGVSLTLGLFMGAFTPVESTLYGFVSALAKIPPLALLPIIFIFQGAGDPAKITIIALGIAPTMTLDILLRARDIPRELITKAYTLGASTFEIVFKVILANVWPQVLNSVRLALGPAWVFLIASEAIASEAGLGYRIFVVQRQLGMNVILIYVAWIMVLGLAMDWALRSWISWRYKWAEVT